MPATSKLQIFNMAVANLPAKSVADEDEASLEARECRRFYDHVVTRMLEGPHDWSFANRRKALVAVTNDRDAEWLYAYQLPPDCAKALRLAPNLDALGLNLPVQLSGEPYAEVWANSLHHLDTPYIIENGVIYSNTESATLEYVVRDVSEIALPALVADALALELAYAICIPVKKDKARKAELGQEKELAWSTAIAEDRNRQPVQFPDYISETMVARHGGLPC